MRIVYTGYIYQMQLYICGSFDRNGREGDFRDFLLVFRMTKYDFRALKSLVFARIVKPKNTDTHTHTHGYVIIRFAVVYWRSRCFGRLF